MARSSLVDEIVNAATEWADQNQIDGRRTISLRTHLRKKLEKMGFSSGDISATKEQNKKELLILLEKGRIRTIRGLSKAMGYKSPVSALNLLKELEQEGFVKNETRKWNGWRVCEQPTDQN